MAPSISTPSTMKIFARIDQGATVALEVELRGLRPGGDPSSIKGYSSSTVAELKAQVQRKLGRTSADQQLRLIYSGVHLEDHRCIHEYGVQEHCTVHVGLEPARPIAAPNRPHVRVCFGGQLERQTMKRCQQILQLSFHKDPQRRGYYIALPPEQLLRGEALQQKIDELYAQAGRRGETWHLVYDPDGTVAALATTFEHRLLRADGAVREILALGEVATHPEYRGRGYGIAAVRAAFDSLGRSGREVMLWQTGQAQGLYEKLGARVVPTENIINSNCEDLDSNPNRLAFWDVVAMIYPADAPWDDEETVDLQVAGW
eukprot:SAG31_NODE_62_length_28678_cov_21.548270_7_plen_316_part_00